MVSARTARALLTRTATSLAAARWLLLGLALAVFGILDASIGLPGLVSATLAAVSAVLVVLDVVGFRRDQRRTRFRPRDGDGFEDVSAAIAALPQRFAFAHLRMGSFVWDLVASRELADDTRLAARGPIDYVPPVEIRATGRLFQRRTVARSVNAYNAPVLGLNTDLGTGDAVPSLITTQPARYWSYLASDGLAAHDTVTDGRDRPEIGRSLFVDRRGRLRDFEESWLLNAIGVSVLAVTSDGRHVVVSQSERNDSSKGLFAPSGSGSLEPQDYRGAEQLPFQRLCANGALRELAEETSIEESDVESWELLGFGRWLDKAAKPEVLMMCFLTIDSHEVARRVVPRRDRTFTLAVEAERFSREPAAWDDADLRTVTSERVLRTMSVPLEASLAMLARRYGQSGPTDALRVQLDARVVAP